MPNTQQNQENPHHEPFTYPLSSAITPWIHETKEKYNSKTKEERRETAEQKIEGLKGRIDAHLDDLYQSLQNGQSEKVQQLLTFFAGFRQYSMGNQILITVQCKGASLVAGYKTWEEKGRTVKKGEKGIAILAPLIKEKRAEAGAENGDQTEDFLPDNPTTKKYKTDEEKEPVLYGFRTVYVFDIEQTEGEPIPNLNRVQGDARESLERLKRYATERSIVLEYVKDLGAFNGRSHMGRIEIVKGKTPAEEFRILAHELAHEELHPDIATRKALPKQVKETEAEAVAFVICQAIGLDMSTVSQDYIHLSQGSPEMLTASLERIRVASNTILTGLEKTEATGKKASKPRKSPTPPAEPKQKNEEPKYETLTLDL
jgi:Zn-dependent peptidase ImmA (M78 family)